MSVRAERAAAAVPPFVPDRSSPVPLYYQVAQHLEAAIISGEIAQSSSFENEIVLAGQLGLSRPTMRRAMQYLVDKGLIVRRRGIGTRVVQPQVRRQLDLTSLYDDLAGSGQAPTTTVIELGTTEADDTLAERLSVPVESPLIYLERLRRANDRPIARLVNYLPAGLLDLDVDLLQEQGLYQVLRGRGIQLHSAVQNVGARTATPEEAELLEEPVDAALLTMQRVTFDDHGRVVEYGDHLYAASRYSFEINLLSS